MVKKAGRYLIDLVVLWTVNALSLGLGAWITPGMSFQSANGLPAWLWAVLAAALLAVVNLVLRAIVLRIAMPLGWVFTLVIGFLLNAVALWITASVLPGFEVGVLAGLFGGIVIAFVNTILIDLLNVNEENSWYQKRIERMAGKEPFSSSGVPGRGLMMIEVDGLSYWHIQQAIDDGHMPTLQKMRDDGYRLSRVDCGLPSMTSSCQAGIMFGDNFDIPAYRWYDKSKKKLYVSAHDASELNSRYAHGHGLMRQGSSIMNMMNGDAEKSMFTMANMFEAGPVEKKRRAEDVALLMLNPYFLTRALALFFADLLRELWEAWQQHRKNVQPRLNRLKEWYPFVRAGTCSLMREISANLAILDMMRGAPSIYMLYLGYDEVAHHSGPWTGDAFGELKRLDKTLARVKYVVDHKAARPYDFILLSDHGQSSGATFKQRYGLSIKEFIQQHMPGGTTVAAAIGGDRGGMGLQSVAGELANVSQSNAGNAFDRAVARRGQRLAQRGASIVDVAEDAPEADVTAYGSGNAAQVYFHTESRKILLSELNSAFPGVVDALVQHEGIGLVVGYEDDGSAVVMGKNGRRNLHTGAIEGEDPLLPYAPASGHGAASVETRAWQLQRVMDFPSAGDLWVISTMYPDGTTPALEELIGSHGGVGGEQTDAFIFHPSSMDIPETRCSTDVFAILNQYRPASTAVGVPGNADLAASAN